MSMKVHRGGGRLKGIVVCSVIFTEQGDGRLLKQGRLLQRLRYMVLGVLGVKEFIFDVVLMS